MKYFLLSILLLAGSTCPAQQPHTLFFSNGQKALEGKWTYTRTPYLSTNLIDYLYAYDGNEADIPEPYPSNRDTRTPMNILVNTTLLFDGPLTAWYRAGGKHTEMVFVNGSATGPCTRYYQNGTIATSGKLRDGMPDGPWRFNNRDGKTSFTGTYRALTQAELEAQMQERITNSGNKKANGFTAAELRERTEALQQFFDNPEVSDTLRATLAQRVLFNDLHALSATDGYRHGEFVFYYPDGSKKGITHYTDNIRTGTWTLWGTPGGKQVVLEYSAGTVTDFTGTDGRRQPLAEIISSWRSETAAEASKRAKVAAEQQAVTSPVVFQFVEQMPAFDGNLDNYLSRNISYPAEDLKNGVQGKVVVRVTIYEDGSVNDATVVRSASKGLDAEALRVVRAMPKWKPGKQNGRAVKTFYNIPVTFSIR